MQDHPHQLMPEDTGDTDEIDQLENLMSADRLLTMWARRLGPADI